MTEELSSCGARVIGCARSAEKIAELNQLIGGGDQFFALDITDDSAVADFAETALDRFGAPDFLINNAALINQLAPLWEVPAAEFSDIIDVNIKGTANLIRHVVPAMIERGKGIIVNFSSGWGRSTSPERAPYCATKYAVEGLTSALAQELPSGLAAVSLNPGIIDTDMLRIGFGSAASGYQSPADWAETAVPFLLGLTAKDNGAALTAP